MGFEIHDGKEQLPPEEDIYGVNDIEERERFNALFATGELTQEERLRRRKTVIVTVALLLLLSFVLAFVVIEANGLL